MKTYKQLINEGYDDRVKSTVVSLFGTDKSMNKNDFNEKLETLDVVERKVGNKAWADFKKDVLSYMKKHDYKLSVSSIKTSGPKPVAYTQSDKYHDEKIPVYAQEIDSLGSEIEHRVSNSFPNEPDLEPYFRRKGWQYTDAYDKLVPIACKKYLGVKDLNTYLKNMWDDSYGDAKSDYDHWKKNGEKGTEPHLYKELGSDKARNPWK